MTVPQDTRSPWRQQRWIECYNASASTLSAFSPAQIIEATRPESATALTPDGGRTSLTITIAEKDNPEAVTIIGPYDIAPETYGICTCDYPCYALVSGSPAVGDYVGLASGATSLASGYYGFVIVGDLGDGKARVMKTSCYCG